MLTATSYQGKVGGSGSGYELEILQDGDPRALALLKGGLGDVRSDSLYSMAKRIVEKSDGEVAAGLIATTRPRNLIKIIRGNPVLARQRRSQSVYGALRHAFGILEPEQLIAAGHSQGGISILDGVAHGMKRGNKLPSDTQLVTIDTPSLFGSVEYDGFAFQALAELGVHCAKDLHRVPPETMLKIGLGSLFKQSMFEPIYFQREANYLLNNLDMRRVVSKVREQYDVHHIFHRDDVVPGAEHEGSPFVSVLEGGHIEAITEEGVEPVVDFMLDLAVDRSRLVHA